MEERAPLEVEPEAEPEAVAGSEAVPSPAPSRWRPSRRSLVIQGGLVLALIVAGLLFRDSLSSPADQLTTGDCFDDPPESAIVLTIQHRPCAGPHDAEVVAVSDVTGSTEFPGQEGIASIASQLCIAAFELVVGHPFDTDTAYDLGYLHPTEWSWRQGDREVACYVVGIDGQPLTGPLGGE